MRSVVVRGRIYEKNAYTILRKYWEPRLVDNIRNMKPLKDGSGVVFDIKSENFEKFIENFNHLKNTESESRIDFSV